MILNLVLLLTTLWTGDPEPGGSGLRIAALPFENRSSYKLSATRELTSPDGNKTVTDIEHYSWYASDRLQNVLNSEPSLSDCMIVDQSRLDYARAEYETGRNIRDDDNAFGSFATMLNADLLLRGIIVNVRVHDAAQDIAGEEYRIRNVRVDLTIDCFRPSDGQPISKCALRGKAQDMVSEGASDLKDEKMLIDQAIDDALSQIKNEETFLAALSKAAK